MMYKSTRNAALRVTAAKAIAQGISDEGGLFVPEAFPAADLGEMLPLDYIGRAEYVLSRFLTDFTAGEIAECAARAYSPEKFENGSPAKVVSLDAHGENKHVLELWHGPTCAFKDMALQILPHLLTKSLEKTADGKTAVILVATSGDTGKAALEGFRDVAGTEMIVFYPENGVSPMQKRQMDTQAGENLCVCAIEGNFDDAQTGVKRIFTDEAVKAALAAKGKMFSSANQLGPPAAADRLLLLRLSRPRAGGQNSDGRPDQRRRADGQFRQHPRGLLREAHGPARAEIHLRLEPQQYPDGFHPHRRIRPQPRLLHDDFALNGHSGLEQPRAPFVPPLRRG